MARSVRILSVGCDPGLMASRSLLLRHQGYEVEEAYSFSKALASARSEQFDVILICHTLPANERRELINKIRECGATMVLCIANTPFSRVVLGENCRAVPNTPAELLASVSSALHETQGLP